MLPQTAALAKDLRNTERFQLEITLTVSDVRWQKVSELLISRYKRKPLQARNKVRSFAERFLAPFDPYWFRCKRLSEDDNALIACMCEVHGADRIILERKTKLRILGMRIGYTQAVKFSPNLRNAHEVTGFCEPTMKLTSQFGELNLTDPIQVFAWRLLVMMALIGLYVVVVGGVIYGAAVFVTFLETPSAGLIAATKSAPLGLALLCIFIGMAGILGRTLRYLFRKIRVLVA